MKYTFRLTVKPIITGSSIDPGESFISKKTVNSETIIDIKNSLHTQCKLLKLQKCIYFTLSPQDGAYVQGLTCKGF